MGSTESKQVESRLQQATLANVKFPAKFSFWYNSKVHIGLLILYNGPTIDAEPIGVIRIGSKMGWHDCVELAAQPGQPLIREELRCHRNGWSLAYTFAMSLAQGSLPERFEWRSSSSDEVKSLGEGLGGWKLVRLGNEDEIVAAASEAKLTKCLTKAGAFQFVGRGASGEFGEAWAVMAVASFVRLWQRRMQAAISASSVA
ncbi:Uncharacterized protein TCAP_02779 [Tolypocladium capitatum]|uniref:Uncharacterized protein n=1 Tax=Tolypocladium capitatum TaxID=45235 RepID=A0A2K3QID4_9HYPO|nr:Uncharacterized protein TCAP_02779 [Tolypocladium capitatum]